MTASSEARRLHPPTDSSHRVRGRSPVARAWTCRFNSGKDTSMEMQVALSHLIVSRDNVRRTNPLVDIDVLAALIKSQGLLQNLIVRDNGDGKFRVVDGKRRRAAIRMLVESGDWPKTKLVPVKVLSGEHNDVEVSLAANLGRVDMHPADTFEAFRHLAEDEGAAPEAIGTRFGYAVSTVRGFLKLANVSPRLMKAFRKDEIALEQIKALAITDDHKRQEAAFYGSPDYLRQPRDLRRLIMEGRIGADDKFARFVGIEAYEAAGGQITRDLFGQDGEVYFEDSGLLHQLATQKLETEAEKLRKHRWKWVEIHPDLTDSELSQQTKVSTGAHGFASDSKTSRFYAGAVLGIDRDGQLKIITGVLKAEDAKALARARADNVEPSPSTAATSAANGERLPATMIEELTATRTAALRVEIVTRPDLGLALVVHDLGLPLFYEPWENSRQLSEIRPKLTDVSALIKDAEANKALAEINRTVEGWRTRVPDKAFDFWPWLIVQQQGALLELLCVLAALNINAIRFRHEKAVPARILSANRLAHSLSLDMTKWWQPDAGFLSRISKASILAAIADAVSPEVARGLDQGSKTDVVTAAERKLKGSTWLPEALRTFEPVEEVEATDEDAGDPDADCRAAAE
ncbi:MAG: ParB/RepB/Spo0J family partition protein [Alphaproteobacteria bacterium]|nr:ParB/RepB/Spo0J family partition protein [Alphaproteobacteria bacterium]